MKKLTIFTPTFNRGYIIGNLYESLLRQTNKDFEWLVVDDGSTDNTEQLCRRYADEGKIDIQYYKKNNGGKHTAANLGLSLAKGELFFVVDSDDYLSDNAVERILYHFSFIENDDRFCGVCGLKAYFNGDIIGSEINYTVLDSKILDYRFKHKVNGDKADVFRTNLLKQYSFPEYPGEKWCPLSIVWNKFNEKYMIRYFAEKIYFAEYLPDGISLNRLKIRKNSPNTCLQYYSELANYDIPLKYKIKAAINYWRFAPYSSVAFSEKLRKVDPKKSLVALPLGYVLYTLDSMTGIYKIFLDPNKKILAKQNTK